MKRMIQRDVSKSKPNNENELCEVIAIEGCEIRVFYPDSQKGNLQEAFCNIERLLLDGSL